MRRFIALVVVLFGLAATAMAQPKPAIPAAAAAPAATALVDINSADAATLAGLPGIGDVRAKAIIAGRPYGEKADLVKSKVLTQSVFDGLSGKIALANVNTSSAKDMAATLPGIGDVRAAAIVKGRPYAKASDLVTKKILTATQFDAIKALVTTK